MSLDGEDGARVPANRTAVLVLVLAIVVTYVASLLLLQQRLAAQEASLLTRGIPYALYGRDFNFTLGVRVESILAAGACLESLLLWLLYRVMGDMRIDRRSGIAFALAVAVMLTVSFQARYTSSDLYHYIFYGKSASLEAAYTAVPHPRYPPEYAGLRSILKEPLPPSVYGPLWQQGDRFVIGRTRTLEQGVRALRFANIVALLMFFASLIALQLRSAVLGVVVLNPALFYLFVVQGSNDVFAIAAIALGLALVRRNLPVAIVLGAAAALVKVSTLGVALATLCTAAALRTRLGSAAAMVAIFAVFSLLLGRSAYLHAVFFVGSEQVGTESSRLLHVVRLVLQAFLAVVALGAVVASLGFRRFVPSAVFTFPAISGLVHPQYFAWGLPYAIARHRTAALAASALPLFAFFGDSNLIDAFRVHFTLPIFGIIAGVVLVQLYRRAWAVPLRPKTRAMNG